MSTQQSEPSPGHGWTPQQWQAVASPHRLQLMILMRGLGEATVNQLAELTGRSAQSLYPHLDALLDAGFLEIREAGEGGRRSRAYACGPTCRSAPFDPATGRGNAQFAEMAALLLHDACARVRRFGEIAEGLPTGTGVASTSAFSIELTWLDDELRTRVNEHFDAIRAIIHEGRARHAGRRTNILLAHYPDVTLREAKAKRLS